MANRGDRVYTSSNPNETTEWEDILVSKGIILDRATAAAQKLHQGEKSDGTKSDKDQFPSSDDDDVNWDEDIEDENVLEAYRLARIQRITSTANNQDTSSVSAGKSINTSLAQLREILKQDFVREVNGGSQDNKWVFLIMYQPNHEPSIASRNHLAQISEQHVEQHHKITFLQIIAQDCVPNYPEKRCPTLLCYFDGSCQTQLIAVTPEEMNSQLPILTQGLIRPSTQESITKENKMAQVDSRINEEDDDEELKGF
eukprot:g2435.t1